MRYARTARRLKRVARCLSAATLASLLLARGCLAAAEGDARSGCDSPSIDPAAYRVIELPLLPTAINAGGAVVGTTKDHRAGVWTQKSGLTLVPLAPGLAYMEAVSINASWQVLVIGYDQKREHRQAYLYQRGKLAELSGSQSRGFRIDDAGKVVGEALAPNGARTVPVLWDGPRMNILDNCCGGVAKDIGHNGSIVGDLYDERGRYGAFRWTPGAAAERIGPPDAYSSAIAINGAGHILIQSFSSVQLYDGERMASVQLAPKLPNHPHAMNDCDEIVGEFGAYSDKDLAFRWTRGRGFEDLNTLISPGSGWKLETAQALNDGGAIVGRGDREHIDDVGYLLLPVSQDEQKPQGPHAVPAQP